VTAENVLVIGAGGHATVVIDILRCSGIEPAGLVDDDDALQGKRVGGVPVIGRLAELGSGSFDAAIVAIGDNHVRAEVSERLRSAGTKVISAVHPSSVISPTASIGPGTMICAGAVVNPHAEIGEGVILNTACSVDHHSQIGPFAHIAPGAHLGGHCRVGIAALVGLGSSLLPGTRIGSFATVGAGSVVLEDVDEGATVIGNPAAPLRSAYQ
jgi:sugar O-acyltransferase (sialic acid O-acetyltransferase NeuD family)